VEVAEDLVQDIETPNYRRKPRFLNRRKIAQIAGSSVDKYRVQAIY
jgi:hypothetical protein